MNGGWEIMAASNYALVVVSAILIQHFITLLMRSRKGEYKCTGSQGKIYWQMG